MGLVSVFLELLQMMSCYSWKGNSDVIKDADIHIILVWLSCYLCTY